MMRIVKVEWVDSSLCGSWVRKTGFEKSDMRCVSVGFLFKNFKDRLVICQGESSEGEINNITEIPKVSIIKAGYLSE